ncbi:MAG: hypothetical protein OXI33_08995 [Chloroflexota bacterium]|nr:hypothetical protein [Chloroflexota bacterium]
MTGSDAADRTLAVDIKQIIASLLVVNGRRHEVNRMDAASGPVSDFTWRALVLARRPLGNNSSWPGSS